MCKLRAGRLLEAVYVNTLRIDTAHDMFHGAVFARCIHRLQDNQEAFMSIRIEFILKFLDSLMVLFRFFLNLFLIDIVLLAVRRKIFQIQFLRTVKTILLKCHFFTLLF